MDPKYRTSIPSGYRPPVGESLILMLAKSHDMPVVKVLPRADYERRVRDIQEAELTTADKTRRLGRLAGRCREVIVNEQGKLLVPKDLSESAHLKPEGSVVLLGRNSYFELWNEAYYQKAMEIEFGEAEEDDLGTYD
ncbi:hypothetical protein JIN85_13645 [Luteolibacter pohnpeiensis]|uniref:SpoVT-AbrB domain-containing protein n=1 Tax=Luteolibacter pohnpeiensis TaxID=454153 RepID=A0A934S5H2_9BACT|nr:division/cell wall cluster transcriptional repressor MraZ [Luteolibacter pohnpeiensis]MBK1883465.1 hypothetical protein [Luteolibacter pohnpeiensis]